MTNDMADPSGGTDSALAQALNRIADALAKDDGESRLVALDKRLHDLEGTLRSGLAEIAQAVRQLAYLSRS